MWPTTEGMARAAAQDFAAAKSIHESSAQDYHVAASRLSELTEGAASEAMIYAHKRVAIDFDTTADIAGHLDNTMQAGAALANRLTAYLDQIDHDAQKEIDAAPAPLRPGIVTKWQGIAKAAHEDFTAAVVDLTAYAQRTVDPLVAGMSAGHKADKPDDSTQPLDDSTTGHRDDNSGRGDGRDSGTGSRGDLTNTPTHSPESRTGVRDGLTGTPTPDPAASTGSRDDLTNPPITLVGPPAAPRPANPSTPPLDGGLPTGMSGGFPASGIPGSGQGLGGGNPLSSLTSGMGNLPGTQAPGVPGVPAGAGSVPTVSGPAAAGDPSAALARGLAAGSGASSSLSGAIPPATPQAAAAATPMAGPAPTVPAPPAGMAASSGAVAPPSPAPPSVTAPPATPMPMLPPPGMGGPAAPGGAVSAPAPGLQVAPATVPATSAPAAGPAMATPAGPAPIPAPVATAAQRAAQPRGLSADVLAANQLAWELQAACEKSGYPLDWAVGAFRSASAVETVVMSGDGFGYVPEGVFLPRSVRLLVADPVVKQDKAFRDYWFGWVDPARVLVTYAGLRAESDWRLVAAASTRSVNPFEQAGVEHGRPCLRENSPLLKQESTWQPPGLDDMHVHRLQLEYPSSYDRLARVTDVGLQTRLMAPLGQELVQEVKSSVGVDCPAELGAVWAALMNRREEPSPQEWASYDEAFKGRVLLYPYVIRPGTYYGQLPEEVSREDHAAYERAWLVARIMAHVRGWMWRPLPLADMVYEAAATHPGSDLPRWLDSRLEDIEQDLREKAERQGDL